MGRIKRGLLLGMVLGMLLTGNENAYIDFYSTHYYNWQKTWFGTPLAGTPEQFGLKEAKPCMVGETHNDDAAEIGMSLTEKYKTLHTRAGAVSLSGCRRVMTRRSGTATASRRKRPMQWQSIFRRSFCREMNRKNADSAGILRGRFLR